MTANARFKKVIRQYMADHNVNYTTARREVLAQRNEAFLESRPPIEPTPVKKEA